MILRILLKLKKNLSILDIQYFLLKDLYNTNLEKISPLSTVEEMKIKYIE